MKLSNWSIRVSTLAVAKVAFFKEFIVRTFEKRIVILRKLFPRDRSLLDFT
jgi:hypothetical protein